MDWRARSTTAGSAAKKKKSVARPNTPFVLFLFPLRHPHSPPTNPPTMSTMKAVVCRAVGPPDSLAVSDEPLPAVGDGELLVRAVGAGVNPVDWKTRGGGLPAIKLPKVG